MVRGVGGVCDMCMCLARGGVGCVWGERIDFGLYQSWRNSGKMGCVCVLVAVVRVVLGGKWVGSLGQDLGGWGVVTYVCVVSLDSLC